MKSKSAHQSPQDLRAAKCNSALRKLNNFCVSYKPEDIDEISARLLAFLNMDEFIRATGAQERIMDYLEALEEVLPAIHEINSYISSLGEPAGEFTTYKQRTAYREHFCGFKA